MDWAVQSVARGVAYLAVTMACLLASRRDDRHAPGYWPLFWPVAAVCFGALAFGRATELAGTLADAARDAARAEDWYGRRRRWQATLIAVIAIGWTTIVVFACGRTPERRRRYLPMTLATVTVSAYVAMRTVSLHQVDDALRGHGVADTDLGTMIEAALLAIAGLIAISTILKSSAIPSTRGSSDE